MSNPLVNILFGSSKTGLRAKLRRHNIRPDVVVPGNIAIDMGQETIFNIAREVGVGLAEIASVSVYNAGEPGFMDNYILSIRTTNYAHPRLDWPLSTVRDEADQAALIIGDVVSGAFPPSAVDALPANVKALTRNLAGAGR